MNAQFGTRYRFDVAGFFELKSRDMVLEPTAGTPFVRYSRDEKILMIKGNSTRTEIHEFYEPVINVAKAHINEGLELDIVLFFSMINPTTAKVLFNLFKFLRMKGSGSKVFVTWCAEAANQEMHETGQDFAELYDLNFKFLSV